MAQLFLNVPTFQSIIKQWFRYRLLYHLYWRLTVLEPVIFGSILVPDYDFYRTRKTVKLDIDGTKINRGRNLQLIRVLLRRLPVPHHSYFPFCTASVLINNDDQERGQLRVFGPVINFENPTGWQIIKPEPRKRWTVGLPKRKNSVPYLAEW